MSDERLYGGSTWKSKIENHVLAISPDALFAGVMPLLDAGEGAMKELFGGWQFWAALSAGFAALTAIFAKVGIENVNSDFATFFRTIVLLVVVTALLFVTKEWQSPSSISARTYVFLTLSGLATGASWLCYFRALKIGEASRVAPIDKLSVVLVAVFAYVFLGERLSGLHWTGVALIAVGAVVLAIK